MMPSNADEAAAERLEWIATHGYEATQLTTNESKFMRKLKENPFVPIGCLATAGILTMGLSTMITRDKKKSQRMMRLRVLSQGITVAAIMVGVVYNAYKKPEA